MGLTIAVLSWKAHKTLKNTLESYKAFGLDKLAHEKLIYFQEITGTDREIAQKYGYTAIGSEENIGIARAYTKLVEKSTGDLFLFLENDWQLIEEAKDIIEDGIYLLTGLQNINVVRFRHRRYPGHPLWTLQYRDNELERPEFLLDSIHWTNPAQFIQIEERVIQDRHWWTTTSRYANWTNNPTMFRTRWLKKWILPRMGTRDVEVDLQEWWREQDFGVAQGNGLFTHNRIG